MFKVVILLGVLLSLALADSQNDLASKRVERGRPGSFKNGPLSSRRHHGRPCLDSKLLQDLLALLKNQQTTTAPTSTTTTATTTTTAASTPTPATTTTTAASTPTPAATTTTATATTV
ncbi:spore coat protein SP96-like isoform X2 [Melanotaenia boesemani]|uniref:spore coat protein SP96-like isoform X2 n=1 Tax=Melanotaenia boesemani TaxID=1250792 RepID=UPI001C057AFB|nr:spore coat protein SP96-like isoform X2 [Melanotaenia boesemani]